MRLAYPFREVGLNAFMGSYAWLLHRISGLVLLTYLALHFWALAAALNGRDAFNIRMAAFHGPLFEVLEGLVVVAGTFHLFNGLRLIAIELLHLSKYQKHLSVLTFAMTVAGLGWMSWISIGRLALHP